MTTNLGELAQALREDFDTVRDKAYWIKNGSDPAWQQIRAQYFQAEGDIAGRILEIEDSSPNPAAIAQGGFKAELRKTLYEDFDAVRDKAYWIKNGEAEWQRARAAYFQTAAGLAGKIIELETGQKAAGAANNKVTPAASNGFF